MTGGVCWADHVEEALADDPAVMVAFHDVGVAVVEEFEEEKEVRVAATSGRERAPVVVNAEEGARVWKGR